MTDADLDPVLHAPVRLRITVTLSTCALVTTCRSPGSSGSSTSRLAT